MVHFDLNEDLTMLRDTAKDFADKELVPNAARWITRTRLLAGGLGHSPRRSPSGWNNGPRDLHGPAGRVRISAP